MYSLASIFYVDKEHVERIGKAVISEIVPLFACSVWEKYQKECFDLMARAIVNGMICYLWQVEDIFMQFMEANGLEYLKEYLQALKKMGKKVETVVIAYMDAFCVASQSTVNG